jgi:hypothetical protein
MSFVFIRFGSLVFVRGNWLLLAVSKTVFKSSFILTTIQPFAVPWSQQLLLFESKLTFLASNVHHQNARGPYAPYQPYAAARSISAAM